MQSVLRSFCSLLGLVATPLRLFVGEPEQEHTYETKKPEQGHTSETKELEQEHRYMILGKDASTIMEI